MTVEEYIKLLQKILNRGDSKLDNMLISYERELLKNYEEVLKEIKSEIAAGFEKYGEKRNEWIKYNRLTNIENQIAEQISTLTNRNIETTSNGIMSMFRESYYRTGFALESTIKTSLGFGLLDTKTVSASLVNDFDRVGWVKKMELDSDLYNNILKNELSQGLTRGSGYVKIAKAINDKTFGPNPAKKIKGAAYKTLRTVRTEGHRAQSASRVLAFGDSKAAADRLGIEFKRTWLSTLDSNTRDDHWAMQGKSPGEDGKYTFPDGIKTDGPGLSGVLEQDVNCRCTETAKIGGSGLTKIRDNQEKGLFDYDPEELRKYKNYDDWKKGLK